VSEVKELAEKTDKERKETEKEIIQLKKVEDSVEVYLGSLPSQRTQRLPPNTRTALYSPCIKAVMYSK
jgi:hypothetical protein